MLSTLLSLFYSYFGGLEQLINNHLSMDSVPDYTRRRKTRAIADDISALGGKLPALAPADYLPQIISHGQALGALYVIEGSTLGGKIISRMVGQQLGLSEGLTFFQGYGEDTMAMWQRFQAVLDQRENLPGTELIDAANQTFLKFSEWFDLLQ
ncbi:biliverdin-producing heme oxygenase [Mucilaginibacter aquaedulcis]|uniref:biliverdin-producing heme oxygenase n=1 Tax=Mucilaginibacter aquaedulcis TaxID=1187081 RepID=UPI0025B58127|nr:biliverdin-producing heme oxygenase [Mucilaginibacter aquaedulcis]MDN3547836.1 biliverdin-producing heme oxygenase [Mucilaginibacter aquaedulcis]